MGGALSKGGCCRRPRRLGVEVDDDFLQNLKREFELRTSASGVQGLLKAILVSLMARGLDFEPELLFVSKGDVLAMIKAKLG